jgi:hypothetical protein
MSDRSPATSGSAFSSSVERPTPARRLVATGIKRTGQAWIVEQPPMSQADCHAKASHVRRPAMTS